MLDSHTQTSDVVQLRKEAERGRKWIVTSIVLAIAIGVAGTVQLSVTDSGWWGFPVLLVASTLACLSCLISMGVELRRRKTRIALFESQYGADAGR